MSRANKSLAALLIGVSVVAIASQALAQPAPTAPLAQTQTSEHRKAAIEKCVKVSSSVDLAVPADKVWKLIGGFGSLPDWLPYIPKSELAEGGRIRRSLNPDGSTIIERLMAFD